MQGPDQSFATFPLTYQREVKPQWEAGSTVCRFPSPQPNKWPLLRGHFALGGQSSIGTHSVMLADARRRLKALLCPIGEEEARGISPHFCPETIQTGADAMDLCDHRRQL